MTGRKLDEVQKDFFESVGDVRSWCQGQYDNIFAKYFEELFDLSKSVYVNSNKLTDGELEWILTSVPLQLISVSEELSQYKLNIECLKLRIKQMESEYVKDSDLKTVSARRDEASLKVLDYRVLLSAYSSVASRVDSEINFSRELIMSAKKIWDSRRKVYEANPVSESDDLESYTYPVGKE